MGGIAAEATSTMCYLSSAYCSLCRCILSRELVACRKSKERYLCVSDEAYDANNVILVASPDGRLSVDLTMVVKQERYEVTCEDCKYVRVHTPATVRRRAEDREWHQREMRTEYGYEY